MFIDRAQISVAAGNGGNGSMSFRTEKYVPNGGPDGGDGGRGGDVILLADRNLSTLQDFRYKRKYQAQHGADGGKKKMYGKSGENLSIRLPVGSLIYDAETDQLLADFTEDAQSLIVAKGGKGGLGNVHFANSVRQAPAFAKAGQAGEEIELRIELKLIADVGLLGMPNVGKSTLLSVVSQAKPKIADYPFTTLEPQLGLVTVDESSFVLADIPGLIEGASAGLGLGDEFLRHVERTRLLLHVIDVSGLSGRKAMDDFHIINRELETHAAELAKKPQIIVGSKCDLAAAEDLEAFSAVMLAEGHKVFFISAPIHEGIAALMQETARQLALLPPVTLYETAEKGRRIYQYQEDHLKVEKRPDGFYVSAAWVENLVMSVNFDDVESLHYFQRTLKKRGVIQALEAAGIQEGDMVSLDDFQFEFIP